MHGFHRVAQSGLLALALTVPAAASAQTAAPKFAYINSQQVLDRAPGRAAVQAQITREREAAQATVQKMSDSLKVMFDEYNKVSATLTATQKEAREKGIRDKQAEFDQRMNQLDQQMQQRQFELVQPMMAQIREVLDAIRNEDGYTMIFDVAAEGGSIVAADKNLDITDRVVARLKPIAVNVTRTDSTKAPAAAKPTPAGITRPPTKPPTQ
jgi:outer membrane protein